MKFVCVLTTLPTLASAKKLSRDLLKNKLAACVSLIPIRESHYVWKRKIQKSREVQLVIKTRASLFAAIEKFFKKNHPYEVPEIIAFPILKASATYSAWLLESTKA